MNNSLNDVSVKNWDCSSILNNFGLGNWIKMVSTIHNSKSYMAKTTFFGGSVTLFDEYAESRESKVTSIVLRRT
jgi:hypothetical protein